MANEVLARATGQGDGTSVWTRFTAAPPILQTNQSIGTPGTGVTATEQGNKYYHITDLSLAVTAPAIAGGANLAVGNLIYTYPAGALLVTAAYMAVAFTESDGNITADTPDVGVGTVIGSGVVAVLGGTATFENHITGQTAAGCAGQVTTFGGQPTAGADFAIATGDAHTVYLNWADGWAASGEAAGAVSGTVRLIWTFIG